MRVLWFGERVLPWEPLRCAGCHQRFRNGDRVYGTGNGLLCEICYAAGVGTN